jgi:hypothetical protein
VAVRAVAGAVIFDSRIAVNGFENIAKEEVGVIGRRGWGGGWIAFDDVALEGGEEGELTLGAGAENGPHVSQIWMAVDENKEFAE